MAWDLGTLVQKIWEARKRQDPSGWFLESPAAYVLGESWAAVEKRLPTAWRSVFAAHRARWPRAFAAAEARAQGAVMAVFRPEGVLLVPVVAPFLKALPAPGHRLENAAGPGRYPLAEPRVIAPLALDPAPPADELPVHPHWLSAQFFALTHSTCDFPPGQALASVYDPGPEPEPWLDRLTFLQAQLGPRLGPGLREANRALADALRLHRDRLKKLPPAQGPYFLAPMRTGLLFVGQAGNALPVLLGGEADYRALLARAVPEDWGPVLGLLPLDREARPLEDPTAWAEAVARRNGVTREDLRAWIERARLEAKIAGRGGALVVGKWVTGFIASPVVWAAKGRGK